MINQSRMSVSCLCLCALAILAGPAAAVEADEDEDGPPSISVTGTGRISAMPDIAEVSIGVVTQAKTAQEALASNAEAMTTLHNLLKERGVAAKDVQTNQFQISPQYGDPRRDPGGAIPVDQMHKIVGFRVENTVHITARQIDKLGSLLDAVVGAGANQVHSLTFGVDDPGKLLDEARRRAIADAKHTAELFAGEAGVVLGSPLKIVESGESIPMQQFRNFATGPAPMMAAPTPIAAGEQELSVSVQVVYEIKRAK